MSETLWKLVKRCVLVKLGVNRWNKFKLYLVEFGWRGGGGWGVILTLFSYFMVMCWRKLNYI